MYIYIFLYDILSYSYLFGMYSMQKIFLQITTTQRCECIFDRSASLPKKHFLGSFQIFILCTDNILKFRQPWQYKYEQKNAGSLGLVFIL